MKTKGYTPPIVAFCNKLDEKLDILCSDLKLYLNDDTVISLSDQQQEKETHQKLEMIEFFRECCTNGLSDLITQIKSLNYKDSSTNYILLARLLQAIPELCPSLKACLNATIVTKYEKWDAKKDTSGTVVDHWNGIKKLFMDESYSFWRLWIAQFKCSPLPTTSVNLNMLLNEFSNWETVTIEENDEHENTISSIIRVPSQPSFFLQEYLYSFCRALNEEVPHTIPKTVTNALEQKIVETLLVHYKKLSDDSFVQTNQNTALQYFFDIKFINYVLVSRESKKLLDEIQHLCNKFKSFVDPFDFELFFKHLNIYVKKAGHRMQHQLGCIIPNNEQLLSSALGTTTTATITSQDREPNILAQSSNATTTAWFPLLPIVTSSSSNLVMDVGGGGGGGAVGGMRGDSSSVKVNLMGDWFDGVVLLFFFLFYLTFFRVHYYDKRVKKKRKVFFFLCSSFVCVWFFFREFRFFFLCFVCRSNNF